MVRCVDVAVVGAGFAGLACARVTASRGLRTVVLDRKPDPGASPHTTGLLVKEAADEWDVPRTITRKIRGIRLYSPSLSWIDLESPGYYFLATDTPALLRWLASEAEISGAQIRCRTEYRGAVRVDGRIRLAAPDLEALMLVGADGPRSRVARDFGLGVNRSFLVGVEAEYEGVRDLPDDRLHCFLDSQLAAGYLAWVVPGVGCTQVGLACRSPGRPRLDLFLRRVSKLCDFGRARLVGRRAGLIPVGGTVRPFGAANVLLTGDAAGLVSPLTAGGIHTALHFGRRAAQAVSDFLLDGGLAPERALRREYPGFPWKRILRVALDVRPPNRLLDLLLETPPLRALAQTVFFHHRGLFSPAAWLEFVHARGV